jgi:hypothetical protein
VSAGAPVSHRACCCFDRSCGGRFADDDGSSERAESVRSGTLETSTVRRVMIVVVMRSAEEC